MTAAYPEGAGPYGAQFAAVPMTAPPTAAPAARARPISQPLNAQLIAGRLIAELGPAPSNGWNINRMSIQASTWSIFRLFVGETLGMAMAYPPETISYSGDGDEYDAAQPIYVGAGQTAYFVWETGTGIAAARITYEEVI